MYLVFSSRKGKESGGGGDYKGPLIAQTIPRHRPQMFWENKNTLCSLFPVPTFQTDVTTTSQFSAKRTQRDHSHIE